MKLIKFLNNEFLENIKSNYNLNDLKVVKYGEYDLLIIFLEEENQSDLKQNWQKLSSILSEAVEDFLVNPFIMWNVYILYIVKEEVTNEVKYKIENNTFFARKIIEDSYELDLSDENIQELIEQHITFSDIELGRTPKKSEEYTSESKVYLELKDLDSIDKNQIDEILNLLEEDAKNEN